MRDVMSFGGVVALNKCTSSTLLSRELNNFNLLNLFQVSLI